MIVKNNIKSSSFSWLGSSYKDIDTGVIAHYYEPESIEELVDLCGGFYKNDTDFEIIGHTSNIYFLPNYRAENVVSTRKLTKIYESEDKKTIRLECGVSVSKLSRQKVLEGVVGFEGLVDLPGTVAAAVYGNAGCLKCSVNALLSRITLLTPTGQIVELTKDDLGLTYRSSLLKRKVIKGVILYVELKQNYGNPKELSTRARECQETRKKRQPGPLNNLGTIFLPKRRTFKLIIIEEVAKLICFIKGIKDSSKKKEVFLGLIGAKDLYPYFFNWGRFIWKDSEAHKLFWKYVNKRELMFGKSTFEIEIKGDIEEWKKEMKNIDF